MENLLGTAGDDGFVNLFDISQKKLLSAFAQKASVRDVVFSPSNKHIMCSAGLEKSIYLYDINEKAPAVTIKPGFSFQSLAFSADGQTIACG